MTWKELAFIVLMSYVSADAATTETSRWKSMVALILGIYAAAAMCMCFLYMDVMMALL